MARNRVRLQQGLSEPEFERLYGTEAQCRAVVAAARWPDGFVCPACSGREHSLVKTRDLLQCTACRRQTSPIAGTVPRVRLRRPRVKPGGERRPRTSFASAKLPLRTWFRALHHLPQTKQGISSIELGRRLGVQQSLAPARRTLACASARRALPPGDRWAMAWTVKHKLGQVMSASAWHLRGSAMRASAWPAGSSWTMPASAANARAASAGEGCGERRRSSPPSRRRPCEVVSDGLGCFGAVTAAGCKHQVVKTNSGPAAARTPAFKWVNTALGNIKAALTGTYRAISSKHVPRCLAEFECRFNRRYDLAAMIPRLAWASVHTPPMSYRLLRLAEVYG